VDYLLSRIGVALKTVAGFHVNLDHHRLVAALNRDGYGAANRGAFLCPRVAVRPCVVHLRLSAAN